MALPHMLLLLVPLTYFTLITGRCPDGTVTSLVDAKLCYKFVLNATDWMDAKLVCNGLGGHLVSITDGFSNLFINGENFKQGIQSMHGPACEP